MMRSGDENMFGKMRWRFDEAAALAEIRKLPRIFIGAFAAMSTAQKQDALAEFNRINQSHFKGDQGYRIDEVRS